MLSSLKGFSHPLTDQTVPSLASLNCSPKSDSEHIERYSRKVFVGGLPPDIDEGTYKAASNLYTTKTYKKYVDIIVAILYLDNYGFCLRDSSLLGSLTASSSTAIGCQERTVLIPNNLCPGISKSDRQLCSVPS